MANFVASILNSGGYPDITVNSGVITVKDHSTYASNSEAGHTQNDFSQFRKIKFINPDGTSYLLSTLGDGQATTIVAAGASLPIIDNYSYTQGDGVYSVALYTVPTWNSYAGYYAPNQPYVFYNGVLYKCLVGSTGNIPGFHPLIWAPVPNIDNLPSKYRVYQQFAIDCDIQTCFANKVKLSNCTDPGCNWSKLGQDKNFIDAERLELILAGLPSLVNAGMWSLVADSINYAKNICCCGAK
jgi:hypothetical protein